MKHKFKIPFLFLIFVLCLSIFISLVFPIFLYANKNISNEDLNRTIIKNIKKENTKIESNLLKKIKSSHINIKKSDSQDEKIKVILELKEYNSSIKKTLLNKGVQIETFYTNYVQALINAKKIDEISKIKNVKFIREPIYPIEHNSEGVVIMNADTLHTLSITGKGVKVAILDLGFLGYTDLLGTELPWSVTTKSFRSGGVDAYTIHGTACAEIVHDVAPDASLYLVNCGTDIEFLNAINWLITQNVDIISISLGWYNIGPYDGTSTLSQAVNNAVNNGVFVSVSSGNDALSHYEGIFSDSDEDKWHNFDGLDEVIRITASSGDFITLYLSWSAPWPTFEDYDLYLYDSSMNVVDYSLDDQSGSFLPPREFIEYYVPSSGYYYIGIREFSTTSNWSIEIFSPNRILDEHNVPFGSVSIPADASEACSVGATYWSNDQLEPFSSQGPTNDGRIKPDVTAPDGVTSITYSSSFYGTSASAPHVAGVAALLLENNPMTPNQIKAVLESTAVDLGVLGKDNAYGSGRIDAYSAFLEASNSPPSVVWVRAFGPDGRLDPGGEVETGNMVQLRTRISDLETPLPDLSVTISYRPQGGDWTTETAAYNPTRDFWNYKWDIPGDAVPGLYDVKVDAEDLDGRSTASTELGEFTVESVFP